MGVKRFEDLVVWQLATQLLELVILITERDPARQDRRFCDQLRSAARSVCSNIAEGFGRYAPREFARFVAIAKASLQEARSLLHEAALRKFVSDEELALAESLTLRIAVALSRLHAYLRHAKAPKTF